MMQRGEGAPSAAGDKKRARLHKNILIMAGEQLFCAAVLFAAYGIGLFFFRWLNIALAALLGAGAFIGYLFCSVKDRPDGLFFFPALFSAGAGLAIAAYFCEVGNNFFRNWPILAGAAGVIFLNAFLLCFDWGARGFVVQNVLSTLLLCGVLAASIVCFCRWNAARGALLYREAALVGLYLFFVLAGEVLYIWFGGDYRHAMNLSYCAAFFIVFFVILLIVTEGDAGDAVADAIVPSSADTSSQKRIKKHR